MSNFISDDLIFIILILSDNPDTHSNCSAEQNTQEIEKMKPDSQQSRQTLRLHIYKVT